MERAMNGDVRRRPAEGDGVVILAVARAHLQRAHAHLARTLEATRPAGQPATEHGSDDPAPIASVA
jgi:hypothetical protein